MGRCNDFHGGVHGCTHGRFHWDFHAPAGGGTSTAQLRRGTGCPGQPLFSIERCGRTAYLGRTNYLGHTNYLGLTNYLGRTTSLGRTKQLPSSG